MPGKKSNKRDLDDIQVLGVWNFTIQPETPLVWLRTGALDRYLLKFQIHSSIPSTAGLIFHSEADGPGSDGVSFWIERRLQDGVMTRRYVLAGDGLESKPLATRKYDDPGGECVEDIEVLCRASLLSSSCVIDRSRSDVEHKHREDLSVFSTPPSQPRTGFARMCTSRTAASPRFGEARSRLADC